MLPQWLVLPQLGAGDGEAGGGQRVLEGEVLDKVAALGALDAPGVAPSEQPAADDPLATLTDRERDVALAVADGLDNAQIATALHLGEGTVRNHISAILAKLALRNRTQIAVLCWRSRVERGALDSDDEAHARMLLDSRRDYGPVLSGNALAHAAHAELDANKNLIQDFLSDSTR